MNSTEIKNEINKALEHLPLDLQQQVLGYIKGLETKGEIKGKPGSSLLEFCDAFDPEDLALIKQAIDEDCSRIDYEDW